jgi:hypothetical protein
MILKESMLRYVYFMKLGKIDLKFSRKNLRVPCNSGKKYMGVIHILLRTDTHSHIYGFQDICKSRRCEPLFTKNLLGIC